MHLILRRLHKPTCPEPKRKWIKSKVRQEGHWNRKSLLRKREGVRQGWILLNSVMNEYWSSCTNSLHEKWWSLAQTFYIWAWRGLFSWLREKLSHHQMGLQVKALFSVENGQHLGNIRTVAPKLLHFIDQNHFRMDNFLSCW